MSARIVVIEERTANRIVLMSRLEAARYEAITATDGAAGLDLIRHCRPDLVLISKDLPDMTGLAVMLRMRATPACRDVPVIMLLDSDDAVERLALLHAGADDALPRSVDPNWLLARGRALMRSSAATRRLRSSEAELGPAGLADPALPFQDRGLTAIVADKAVVAQQLLERLAPHHRNHLVALTDDEALNPTDDRSEQIDAFLLVGPRGHGDGTLRLMSDLRTRGAAPGAAFCLLLDAGCKSAAANAFNMDAQEVLDMACPPEEVAFRLDRVIRCKRRDDRRRAAIDHSSRLSIIDPLTRLHNRRYAERQLDRLVADCHRGGSGLAVMIADLDRFKSVNDVWGHPTGDEVLVEVARRLKSVAGAGDLVARLGGEEFLIALRECDPNLARDVADRLCAAIHDRPCLTTAGDAIPVTVSIGWALLHPRIQDENRMTMIDRADQALLLAKAAGRNCAVAARPAA